MKSSMFCYRSNYCWSFNWLKLRLYHTYREDSTQLRLIKGGGLEVLFKFCSWWLPLVPACILRGFVSTFTFHKDRYSSKLRHFPCSSIFNSSIPNYQFLPFPFPAPWICQPPNFLFVSTFFLFTLPCVFKNSRLSPTSCFFATSLPGLYAPSRDESP